MTGLSPADDHKDNPHPVKQEIADSIDELRLADQTFYNLVTREIWSLAQTMDELKPGFWADYMRNRQAIVRQYIQERRREHPAQAVTPEKIKEALTRKLSPFHPLRARSRREDESQRISSFSLELEQALPTLPPRASGSALSPSDNLMTPVEVAMTGEPSASEASDLETPMAPTVAPPTAGLIRLPHLMRFPVLKPAPVFNHPPAPPGLTWVSIACWLTRNFLVPIQGGHVPSMQKRLDAIAVEPGQTIICQLGFQIVGEKSLVQVQLVKALREHAGLTVKWIAAGSNALAETNRAEAMVQLTNQGTQAIALKAGQAFCHLELLLPTASLSFTGN